MKFRHKIERININGLKEFSVAYFLCDELVVGRGSGCLVRVNSRSAALSHAKVYSNPEGELVVEDLNSGIGTRVNGVTVKKHVLKPGDKVKVADVTFTVFNDGTYWGFHEVREEGKEEDRDQIISRWGKDLDLGRFYPSFTSFSLLLVAAVGLVAFIEPYVGMNTELWSSGPISNAHKMIENDCGACHPKPFEPVQDNRCLNCHKLSDHAPAMKTVSADHPDYDFRCADCHHEHNDTAGIIDTNSKLCTQCHAKLGELYPPTKHPKVSSFNRHPEVAVSIPQYSAEGEPAGTKRVSMDDRAGLVDTTRLKLNHKKHLVKDLRSPDGPKTLACTDCHGLSDDLQKLKPITFEAHCASCHTLGFDERLPTKYVPHGETDTVYNFVYAEYAKLFLETERPGSRGEFVKRFRPGSEPEVSNPTLEFTKQFVEQESRKAEQELFTKTACFLCHQVRPTSLNTPGRSNYRVLTPHLPSVWMPETIFDHGSHQEVKCDSCHGNVRASSETSDVLLPKISDCRSCHGQMGQTGKVGSDCATCHSYHRPLLLPDNMRRSTHEIVSRADGTR